MRAGMVLEALCELYSVSLVVIPLLAMLEQQVPEFLQNRCESVLILAPGEGAPDTSQRFEIVHVFRLSAMARVHDYLRQMKGRALLHLDLDDIESKTNRRIAGLYRHAGDDTMAARFLAAAQRSSLMEAVAYRLFDRIYVCSEGDRRDLGERCRADVRVLRNAVRLPEGIRPASTSAVFRFLFVGTLHYYPNQDGIRFFCTEVLPIVREKARIPVVVTVVGFGDCSNLRDLASDEVRLVGSVADLHPWYEECDAVVVPIRAGGGTRIKILEAFSYSRPVVTTALGLEGIEAVADRDILVADSPDDFAAACLRLMSDPALAHALVANARALVSQSYTIEAIKAALLEVSALRRECHSPGDES
jgi:glycosyltransferase involved in cell wall biosynthesis